MKLAIKFSGGPELAKALSDLPLATEKRIRTAALKMAAEPMRLKMSELAPIRPGPPDLAKNIVISSARALDEDEGVVAVGPARPFFYGLFQEFGTVKQQPRPFMRPAFWATVEMSLGILLSALWRSIERQAQKTAPLGPV